MLKTGTLIAATVLAGASSASPLSDALRPLDQELAALKESNPDLPPLLDLHRRRALVYAQAVDGDCQLHLASAEREAQIYRDNVYALLLPNHDTALANMEALLAYGRSQCAAGEADLVNELQRAREAALRGIEAADRAHDYETEAVLRFNAAHYLHNLGDADGAIGLLKSAIALDDAHGLQDDGAENRELLATWMDVPINALPQAPVPGHVTFHFGWTESRADIDVTDTKTTITTQGPITRTYDTTAQQFIEVRPDGGFRIRTDDAAVQTRALVTSDNLLGADFSAWLSQFVKRLPAMNVGAEGDFQGFDHLDDWLERQQMEFTALLEQRLPPDSPTRGDLAKRVKGLWLERVSADRLANVAAESHSLETAIWIGATLETGADMTVDLMLPMIGVETSVIKHHARFHVSGTVPCTSADSPTDPHCVEIALTATPADDEILKIKNALKQQKKGNLSYWSSLDLNLVVDPQTLFAYGRTLREAHYLGLGNDIEATIRESRGRAHFIR